MIDVKELRIGNIVKMKGDAGLYEVLAIDGYAQFAKLDRPKGAFISDCDWIECKKLKPIPLTEEWLLRLGFEKDSTEWYVIHIGGFKIGVSIVHSKFVLITPFLEEVSLPKIHMYVHLLQNLVSALTGQELTIKQ